MLSRLPRSNNVPDTMRKASCQVDVGAYRNAAEDNDDDLPPAASLYRRRMSVPECVFQKAEYAILRPTRDPGSTFEVLAAFDRHSDPYCHYMQSLTCYDLQPTHSSVMLVYGDLKVKHALSGLSNNGHQAAIVWNAGIPGDIGIVTVTDCLSTLMMADRGVRGVADMTLSEYFKANGAKPLIRTTADTSVWDAARVLFLNRVRSLPVFDVDGPELGSVLYFINMKTILAQTVLKLADPSASFAPFLKQATLFQKKVGTWTDITTLGQNATCKDVIEVILEKKLSSVPIVDEFGHVRCIVSKRDIMRELPAYNSNYLQVLPKPAVDLVPANSRLAVGKPEMSILQAISALVSSDKQALIVTDDDEKPVAVVSYGDIMDYIQGCESSHKNSGVQT